MCVASAHEPFALWGVQYSCVNGRALATYGNCAWTAPTCCAFSTTSTLTSRPSACTFCFRRTAAARPAGPAPTMQTSTCDLPAAVAGCEAKLRAACGKAADDRANAALRPSRQSVAAWLIIKLGTLGAAALPACKLSAFPLQRRSRVRATSYMRTTQLQYGASGRSQCQSSRCYEDARASPDQCGFCAPIAIPGYADQVAAASAVAVTDQPRTSAAHLRTLMTLLGPFIRAFVSNLFAAARTHGKAA